MAQKKAKSSVVKITTYDKYKPEVTKQFKVKGSNLLPAKWGRKLGNKDGGIILNKPDSTFYLNPLANTPNASPTPLVKLSPRIKGNLKEDAIVLYYQAKKIGKEVAPGKWEGVQPPMGYYTLPNFIDNYDPKLTVAQEVNKVENAGAIAIFSAINQ